MGTLASSFVISFLTMIGHHPIYSDGHSKYHRDESPGSSKKPGKNGGCEVFGGGCSRFGLGYRGLHSRFDTLKQLLAQNPTHNCVLWLPSPSNVSNTSYYPELTELTELAVMLFYISF